MSAATDSFLLVFAVLLAAIELLTGGSSRLSYAAIACSITVLSAVLIPWMRSKSGNLLVRLLYIVYVLPLLYLLYPVTQDLARTLHGRTYDDLLIAIDQFLFGGMDPTRWLFAHIHLAPAIVEIFQLSYFAYYLYPLVLLTDLFLRRKELDLSEFRLIMVYGAAVSFIGNMVVPAVGPRFTLHEFANLGRELPGAWITDNIRALINKAEGVNALMTSTQASPVVFPDAFPSGHTMLTLLALIMSFRYHSPVRWYLLPLGCCLILATIFLRYHYVTDVIGGALLALFIIWTAPALARVLSKLFSGRTSTT